MSIPKWIPKAYKSMMVSFRPATPEDDIDDLFLVSQEQLEAEVQKQIGGDKLKAVKNNAAQIKKVKAYIKQAKDKPEAKERLEKWLSDLEVERFGLLRDEILCWATRAGNGFIKNKWVLEMLEKEKTKNKQKMRDRDNLSI